MLSLSSNSSWARRYPSSKSHLFWTCVMNNGLWVGIDYKFKGFQLRECVSRCPDGVRRHSWALNTSPRCVLYETITHFRKKFNFDVEIYAFFFFLIRNQKCYTNFLKLLLRRSRKWNTQTDWFSCFQIPEKSLSRSTMTTIPWDNKRQR